MKLHAGPITACATAILLATAVSASARPMLAPAPAVTASTAQVQRTCASAPVRRASSSRERPAPPTTAECQTHVPDLVLRAHPDPEGLQHEAPVRGRQQRSGTDDRAARIVRFADGQARSARLRPGLRSARSAVDSHGGLLREDPGVRPGQRRHGRLGRGDDASTSSTPTPWPRRPGWWSLRLRSPRTRASATCPR